MMIELPDDLEAALKHHARALGVSPAGYVRVVLERNLASAPAAQRFAETPFKTGRGVLAKYGAAPSAEEINANRAEMFRNFGENV